MVRSGPMSTLAVVTAMALGLGAMHSCGPARTTVSAEPELRDRQLSEGYALLYNLMEKNRQVDQAVRIPFRSVSDETRALLREIARASGEAADTLHDLADAAPELGLDQDGLPVLEQATRESIEASSRSDLLTGERERFELYLLLSQVEATRYAAHLAGQLAEADEQSSRRAFLRDVRDRFQQLSDQTRQRLAVVR